MGKVWKYGDDVNTDVIFPGKYTYTIKDRAEMALHACEDLDPVHEERAARRRDSRGQELGLRLEPRAGGDLPQGARHPRDSREELRAHPLPQLPQRGARDDSLPRGLRRAQNGRRDFERGVIKANGKEYPFPPYPEFVQGLINDGGLIPHVKKELGLA